MSKFYDSIRSFATEKVEPYSKDVDEKARFPIEGYNALKDSGYFGLLMPAEYKGMGKTIVEHAEICMGLAESCASTALCYMMSNVAAMCVLTYASKEMKEKYLPLLASGKLAFTLAFSEINTGTHFYNPEIKAEYKDDHVIINGTKSFVTSSKHADCYLVVTKSRKDEQADIWVVPLDAKGLTFVENSWNGLGMRGNSSMQMNCNNVRLPYSERLGEEGSGLTQIFDVVAPYFIIGLAAIYSGIALNISSEASNYSINRKYPNGVSLASIETVQTHLSDIYARAYAASEATIGAARSFIEGDERAGINIKAARIFASEIVIEIATKAMRIVGGKGYNKNTLPIERLLRDSLAGQVMAPGVDVLRIWTGKELTGQSVL